MARADAVQAAIDAIAAQIEPDCPVRVSECELARRAHVQSMVDTVASDIEAMLDPIAAIVGPGDAGGEAGEQDQGQGKPGHGDFG